MVAHVLFHRRTGKTVRDDPDAISFSEMPSPIPRNASLGAHVGKAGMANYENVQLFHMRSVQNVRLRAVLGGRARLAAARDVLVHKRQQCAFSEEFAAHGGHFRDLVLENPGNHPV